VLANRFALAVTVGLDAQRVAVAQQCQSAVRRSEGGERRMVACGVGDGGGVGAGRKGCRNAVIAGSTTVQFPAWTSLAWRRPEIASSVNSSR
jgi:hypothetical protein